MPNSHPALTVSNIVAGYGAAGAPVLHGVSLSVQEGELLAVLGPSGCGKTTMLRVITGLMRARQGTIHLGGKDVTTLPPEKRRVGLVPQDTALFPHLTVEQNISFGIRKDPNKKQRVAELLELVDATELAGCRPAALSGGQCQRIALARALAPRPQLVLLDEPFSALDAALRVRLRTDIAAILKEANTAAILVTHDQDEAMSIADTLTILHGGAVIQSGSPQEVYQRPAHEWIAHFLGTCSILPGGIVLRPEDITLTAPTDSDQHQGTVVSSEFHGHSTLCRVDSSTLGTVTARYLGAPRWAIGDRVALQLPANPHRLAAAAATELAAAKG